MKILSKIFFLLILLVLIVTFLSCDNQNSDEILFQDSLNGEIESGWKVPPENFVEHPIYGKVFQVESEKFLENPPWVGDSSWQNYRVELEILSSGNHWVGLDCHVQEDGLSGFNIQFYTYDSTREITLEACSFEGGMKNGAVAWKLWPVSQKTPLIQKSQWIKLRIDVGESVVNCFINDDVDPVFTTYDMPYSSGGIRFFTFSKGITCFRNLRVISLGKKNVKPVLDDIWQKVRNQNIIKHWEIILPREPEFGLGKIPEDIYSPGMKWISAQTDTRGVLNVGTLFPNQNTKGTIFAKTIIKSKQKELKTAWISYTDRCSVWCNGKQVFKGPNRGWNDPEANHDCRLKPDHFKIELPLKEGDNVVLLRSQVTENWGWGFWMRIE